MTPRQKKRLSVAAGALLIVGAITFVVLRPAELAVIKPVNRDVVEVVVASGTLRAVRQSMVGAESSGVVESLEVTEGVRVQKGDLLGRLRLGETDARLAGGLAALRAAETTLRGEELQLDQTSRELRRARDLAARKLVPVAELDDAESAFSVQQANTDAARARLAEARAQVDQIRPEFGKREVRAPFSGVVIERMIEPGTAVSAGTAWFTIAEMSATEIYVETDENNLGKLEVGQPAIAVAPAYPDQPFSARLTQIGPNVDSERGVVGLRLTTDNLPGFALPNMTIDVNIEVKRSANALALPSSAVSLRGQPSILAVSDGRLERRRVEILGSNPEWVAVAGIDPETLVLREARGARQGQRVRPLGAAASGAARP
ncbi:MAG: efflux RND transporter periplasmic adaptor subunit [Gammaproteobacteria bacterium]|nr:efflux RND transporter periplasmic adaptor subunit [Gammaproteobacteria bacterium]